MNVWIITIVGLGTVFLTLIFLMYILKLFRLIFAREIPVSADSVVVQPPVPVPPVKPAAQAVVAAGPDDATVAAIVAAIAAATGRPASALRLSAIEAASFNTPVWGHIDRLHSGTARS